MRKSILITGCSSGIGRASALAMQKRGWRVFASCRQEADCAEMRSEGFESPRIDYADPDSIRSGLAEVLAATGGTLDALYNNGAFAIPGAVEDLPREALVDIFQTNVFGVHDLTCQVLPVMRAQGHGSIVNCSSVLGLVAAPWRGAYNASKFALEGLTDTLRLEMRDTDINIILLEPGPVTSMLRKKSIPHFERWIDCENSPRAAQYDNQLKKRLYEDRGPDRFELPPSAVAEKLWRALEDPAPSARYAVTTPTYMAKAMRRILPTAVQDWILSKG
ncbi:SDR family NAD(P)-dependent oxidoreductase [Marinovum sp. 2_MG-2023]|nr:MULTISPECIES: SDR family NAD(P)-dependent oxidoreductase [Roseobacteraceae]MCJ7871561.1 SDR family NAD(P)-dependent oxidoreductase [Phaeobacter sp. J2-8]MDO6728384.1 SDR family NAD(P)-dependent oxidoreductase [Marinovum sp. 2_MG-2023]MDO6778200.1 SDR family NAD(P)-dependent oxidoreductase [Marinovum sp. 1_MG-2023]